MKKAVIFDLDGTILDTLDSLLVSVNETMQQLHIGGISREQCRAFVGNGARVLVEKSIIAVQGECSQEFLDEAVGIYSVVFEQNCMHQVTVYDGMKELLDKLRESGYQLAILSNKPHERTAQMVEWIFGADYFTYVQGQMDGMPKKPDPASIEYVMSNIDRVRDECIYIGDSEVDMVTGIAARLMTIGVSWGFRDRVVLEQVSDPHDYMTIVDDAQTLATIIQKSNCEVE